MKRRNVIPGPGEVAGVGFLTDFGGSSKFTGRLNGSDGEQPARQRAARFDRRPSWQRRLLGGGLTRFILNELANMAEDQLSQRTQQWT